MNQVTPTFRDETGVQDGQAQVLVSSSFRLEFEVSPGFSGLFSLVSVARVAFSRYWHSHRLARARGTSRDEHSPAAQEQAPANRSAMQYGSRVILHSLQHLTAQRVRSLKPGGMNRLGRGTNGAGRGTPGPSSPWSTRFSGNRPIFPTPIGSSGCANGEAASRPISAGRHHPT